MNIIKKLSFLLLITTSLSGCAALLIGGGAATVGVAVMQEKSVGNSIDDLTIWTKIKNAIFADKEVNKALTKIGVKVLEGRVLLTGYVSSPEERVKIIKLVWSQDGVKEVINEIVIEGENKRYIKDIALDSWITTQIKSKLLVEDKVESVNYSIETINRVVYLMGIAQNETELDLVTNIAGTVAKVERVVSFVRIRDSKIRQQMLKAY